MICAVIRCDPFKTADNSRVRAGTRAVQYPYANNGCPFSDAILCPDRRAGNVGAMPMTVFGDAVVIDRVGPSCYSARVFVVTCTNSCINDVHNDTGPGPVRIVGIVQWKVALVDAVDAPRWICLV